MGVEKAEMATVAATPAVSDPLAITLSEAMRLSGLSRSELYRRMGNGQIHAVKAGVRTLIVMTSLKAHIASLPTAEFRTPKAA